MAHPGRIGKPMRGNKISPMIEVEEKLIYEKLERDTSF